MSCAKTILEASIITQHTDIAIYNVLTLLLNICTSRKMRCDKKSSLEFSVYIKMRAPRSAITVLSFKVLIRSFLVLLTRYLAIHQNFPTSQSSAPLYCATPTIIMANKIVFLLHSRALRSICI